MAKRCPVCNKPIDYRASHCRLHFIHHRSGGFRARTLQLTDKAIRGMDGDAGAAITVPLWLIARGSVVD